MYKMIVTILLLISLILNCFFTFSFIIDYINTRKLAKETAKQYIEPHELEKYKITNINKNVTWYVHYERPLVSGWGKDHFTIVIIDGKATFVPGI